MSDINNGRWDQVLPQVANLKLPRAKLEDLYEQAREGSNVQHCGQLCGCYHSRLLLHMLPLGLLCWPTWQYCVQCCAWRHGCPDAEPHVVRRVLRPGGQCLQVVLELIELRETETARAMLRQTQVFARMKQDDAERYLRLEHLCNRTYFDVRELYGSTPRDKRRANLAHVLSSEVATVPPSRLLALVGQALKW